MVSTVFDLQNKSLANNESMIALQTQRFEEMDFSNLAKSFAKVIIKFLVVFKMSLQFPAHQTLIDCYQVCPIVFPIFAIYFTVHWLQIH